MSELQVDITQSFDYLLAQKDSIITRAAGTMTYFPLCCSTGTLNDVSASLLCEYGRGAHKSPPTIEVEPIREKVLKAKYIHEIIRAVRPVGSCMLMPRVYAHYYTMSLCHAKCHDGTDDKACDGYSGFKAAQITMFDRTDEDKDPDKGFKFTYNRVYSTDHMMQWLMDHGTEHCLGEILVSTPAVGAHGAEVYGMVWTPDKDMLKKYHDDRIQKVKAHVLAVLEHHYPKNKEVKTSTNAPKGFVSY